MVIISVNNDSHIFLFHMQWEVKNLLIVVSLYFF